MAISFDASNRYTKWDTTGNSKTGSHTIGSGSNAILIVGIVIQGGAISSVTYNGNAMTLVKSQYYATADQTFLLYRLTGVSAGTADVVVTQTVNDRIGFVSASYFGVDQDTPINGTPGGGTTATSPASADITTDIDDCWLVACGLLNSSVTSFTGVSERHTLSVNTANFGDSATGVSAGANSIDISGSDGGGLVSLALTPGPDEVIGDIQGFFNA